MGTGSGSKASFINEIARIHFTINLCILSIPHNKKRQPTSCLRML